MQTWLPASWDGYSREGLYRRNVEHENFLRPRDVYLEWYRSKVRMDYRICLIDGVFFVNLRLFQIVHCSICAISVAAIVYLSM